MELFLRWSLVLGTWEGNFLVIALPLLLLIKIEGSARHSFTLTPLDSTPVMGQSWASLLFRRSAPRDINVRY